MSFFFTLLAVAIPLVIIATILRRAARFAQQFRDPTRLQQVFAESAASALRRAGADPKAITRLEEFTRGKLRRAHAAAAPVAIELPATQPEPLSLEPLETIERHPRPRRRSPAPVSPLGGLDLGDRFRLSEPPDLSEPHGPIGFNANWIAFAVLLLGAAYYLLQ